MIYYYILQLQGENIFIGEIVFLKIQYLQGNINLNSNSNNKKKKKKYLFIDENELIFLEIVIIHLDDD